MKFTNKEFESLRKDIKEALKDVEAKYDISIKQTNITYSDITFKLTMECTKTLAETGESEDQKQFEFYCKRYGFEPEDYNKEMISLGKTYRFKGFNPNARTNKCVIVDVKTGKEYVASVSDVKRALHPADKKEDNSGAQGDDFEKQMFAWSCRNYGFEPEDYNKSFENNGKILHLVGFNSRAPKNPCLLRDEEGKEYKASALTTKMYLNKAS